MSKKTGRFIAPNACKCVGGGVEKLGRFGSEEHRVEMVYKHACCYKG